MKNLLYILLIFFLNTNLSADWIYWKSEYMELQKEKERLALELEACLKKNSSELESCRSECEEKSAKIKVLEWNLLEIQENSSEMEKNYQEEIKGLNGKVNNLEDTIKILKNDKTDIEKNLILKNEEFIKREERYKKALRYLKGKNKKYRTECNSKLSECDSANKALQNELEELRKLTGMQKEQLERMQNQFTDLEKRLANEIKGGLINIRKTQNRLFINLDDRISFASGSTVLKKDVKPVLDKIISILKLYPENLISIEGHTDDIPMKSSRIRDNWQLSSERALSVLSYFLEDKNLDPRRCSAAGFGEFRPLLPNSNAENRSVNRRVEIVVTLP